VAFRIVSGGCYVVFGVLFYLTLRIASVSPLVAFGTTLFAMSASWPMTYSLGNIYQANDAFVYPLALLMILATVSKRAGLLLALSVIGVLTRQNLFVFAVFAQMALVLETRKLLPALALAVVGVLFWLSSAYAGGGAVQSLGHHALFNWHDALKGIREIEIWYLFSPFLLVLLDPRIARYAVRYWWIALFCIISIAQPLGAYRITGAPNAARIVAQGIFPLFLLAGILIEMRLSHPSLKGVYAVMPFLYGNAQLVFVKQRIPALVDYRWFNVLVWALLMVDLFWRWKGAPQSIDGAGAGLRECQVEK
jgi:hypothetical protein